MPISFDVQAIAGTQHFDQIISFHSTAKSDIFYQESLVPFFLMLMRNSTAHPSQNRLTLFTPESQFALFNFDAVHGRGRNSQHQHNCFEFTVVLEGGMYQLVEGKRYYYPAGSCCLMNRNTLHTEELSSDFCCAFVSVTTEFVQQFLGDGRPMLFPEDSAMQRNMIFQFFNENQAETAADSKDFLDFVPKIDHEEQVRVVPSACVSCFHDSLRSSAIRSIIIPCTSQRRPAWNPCCFPASIIFSASAMAASPMRNYLRSSTITVPISAASSKNIQGRVCLITA